MKPLKLLSQSQRSPFRVHLGSIRRTWRFYPPPRCLSFNNSSNLPGPLFAKHSCRSFLITLQFLRCLHQIAHPGKYALHTIGFRTSPHIRKLDLILWTPCADNSIPPRFCHEGGRGDQDAVPPSSPATAPAISDMPGLHNPLSIFT